MKTTIRAVLLTAAAVTGATLSYGQNSAPDATLFTTYSVSTDHKNVTWVVCGSTQNTEGCYDSGSLGPFGYIGAMMESAATVNRTTNTVTRFIYVLDIASGSNLKGVQLNVYKRTDSVTPNFDTTTVTPFKTLPLSIIGGNTAHASMAANNNFLFVGTNRSPAAVEINKHTFTTSSIPGFSPPINVAAITANQYGYVTVTFGSLTGESGFVVIGPDGGEREDGGGADFMLGTQQAFLSSTLH